MKTLSPNGEIDFYDHMVMHKTLVEQLNRFDDETLGDYACQCMVNCLPYESNVESLDADTHKRIVNSALVFRGIVIE